MATCEKCGAETRGSEGHDAYLCRDVLAVRVAEMEATAFCLWCAGTFPKTPEAVTEHAGTCPERRKALDFATIEFLDRGEKLVALADEEVRRERAAHALTRARLEAAERVVDDVFGSRGMAETLNDLCTCGGGGAEHPHSCGACRLYRVTRRLLRSALDALPAAAPARAGDDS